MFKCLSLAISLLFLASCSSQEVAAGNQTPDAEADVSVTNPRFAPGAGPSVLIDGAHDNLHTVDGSYAPFAQLLRNDGLRVRGNDAPFSSSTLEATDLLVISNASAREGSAFSPAEIAVVRQFVEGGGALLLIVDHSPYPAAAHELASAFGAEWLNVYSENSNDGVMTRRSGDLIDDQITLGIDAIRTFGGSCFDAQNMRPLLRAGRGWTIQTATDTGLSRESPAGNCLIGAVAEIGEGRVAFFAEAAMFSAQRAAVEGRVAPMGFNAPGAEQNKAFLLNIIHWLTPAS